MKKTIRTLSMVMMTLAMAICFLFAGLAFVRADVLETVDLGIVSGAQVYVGGTDEDTGIKFTAKILKSDYQDKLVAEAGEDGNVYLGVDVGRLNSNGEFVKLQEYTVNTAGALEDLYLDNGAIADENYYMYSFSVKYNLTNIFGEGYEDKLDTTEKVPGSSLTYSEAIDYMYLDELCVRPFYKIVTLDGVSEPVYGEVGEARSMLHVAQAQIQAGHPNSAALERYIADTEDMGEIEVYADGRTNLELDNRALTYTIGTSGKVIARQGGAIELSALQGFEVGDTFKLFGYTAERTVLEYTATYKGFTGIDTQEITEEFVLDEAGKLYLNNTQFENREIESLFYSDGNFLANATVVEEVGSKLSEGLVARIDGAYYKLTNVLYVTKAFENTRESRLDMVATFSGQNRSHTSYYSNATDKARTVSGYYVLVANIEFDLSNVDMLLGEENKMDEATFKAEGRDAGKENEIFSNGRTGRNITFDATFDGRGYSMANIAMLDNSSSMFGRTTDGSTIKNVAFTSFTGRARKKVTGDDGTVYYYYAVSGSSQNGKIFNDSVSATDRVTLENVYINDNNTSDNGNYGGLFYYETYGEQTANDSTVVPLTFRNVIIVNAAGPMFAGKQYTTVGASDVIVDTYYVSAKNVAWGTAYPAFNNTLVDGNGDPYRYNFIKVSALPKEGSTIKFDDKDKVVDYSTFSSEYWTIVDGIPVWNTASVIATVKDGNSVVNAIESNEAGKEYKVNVSEYGKEVDLAKVTVAGAENLVDYANGKITVKQFVKGEATLTVSYKDAVIATYAVSVDTLPVATLTGENGEVTAIDSIKSNDEYVVTAVAGGKDVTASVELSVTGDDIVTIDNDNKKIIVKQNVEGTATITATVGGVEFTYAVTVNTKAVVYVNGGAVANITSTTANETYTVTAVAGGNDVSVELAKEDANNVITIDTIDGNVITINEKAMGSATVIVKIEGVEVATFTVTVDTSVAEPINDEIIFSAYDGFFHFKGTKLEGAQVSSVKYGSTELLVDGKVDASAITDKNSGDVIVLNVVTTLGKYELSNVKYYDGAFGQDNKTALVDLLNGIEGELTGYYILTESITFDPASADDRFIPAQQIFNATFDGRGYTLNNLSMNNGYGIFGLPGTNAVIKNFAINRIFTAAKTSDVATEVGISYNSVLFAGTNKDESIKAEVGKNNVTMENIYIYRYVSVANRYDNIFTYGSAATAITYTMNNVIIELDQDMSLENNNSGKGLGILSKDATNGSATNTFFTNGCGYTSYNVTLSGVVSVNNYNDLASRRAELIAKDAMKASLSTFSSDYWTIVDGYPMFKSCTDWVTVTNSESEEVIAIGELGDYNVNLFVDGVASADLSAVTVESDSAYVTYDNGVITVAGAGQKYSATITVKYNDVEALSIAVEIDDRQTMPNDEEILLSKANGKLYFNGTTLEGVELETVLYDGTPVYTDGVIDISAIEVAVNTAFVLEVSTANAKYELRNVKMYDGVYAQENKTDLVDLLNDYEGTLNGYFVLAENITFDPTSKEDRFVPATDATSTVFNATFDGRGYTLNNLTFVKGYGIFGTLPGTDTLLKNFAINRVFTTSTASGTASEKGLSYVSLLFGGAKSTSQYAPDPAVNILTMENVYIYRYVETSSRYDWIINYNPSGTINLTNVIIEIEQNNALENTVSGSGQGILGTGNTTGLATNTFFTNGAGASNWTVKLPGIQQYNAYDLTVEERRAVLADTDAMKASLSTFSSDYWTIVDGYPRWITASTYAAVTNDTTKENVSDIAAVSTADTYSVAVYENGSAVETGVTYSLAGDAVATIEGGVITIANNIKGEATLTVTYNEKVIATIAISVDTREAVTFAEEVLISKASGKMYLGETSFDKSLTIEAMSYDDTSVYEEGIVDTSVIDVAVNTAFTLNVITNGDKYTFTNVKMYDGVYNEENKAEFTELLKYTGELTGYYVLAGNMDYSGSTSSQYFAAKQTGDIYNATIDGRGYTITNMNIPSGSTGSGGIFGKVAGDNGVIKNIAFNGIKIAGSDTATYLGFFIGGNDGSGTMTLENVYVYRKIDTLAGGANSSYLLSYKVAENVFILKNFIFEQEFAAELTERQSNIAPGVMLGSATDSYLLSNGRAISTYKCGPEGLGYYGSTEDADISGARTAMATAYANGEINYNTFTTNNTCWEIVNGVPTWKTLPTVAE